MSEQPGLDFAGLLRLLRERALLTQEELAEAAQLSSRSVSDLERGINRTARKDTAELLAGALGLAEPARPLFVAAARGRADRDAARAGGEIPDRRRLVYSDVLRHCGFLSSCPRWCAADYRFHRVRRSGWPPHMRAHRSATGRITGPGGWPEQQR